MKTNARRGAALSLFSLALILSAGAAWWLVNIAHWDMLEASMTCALGMSGICFLYVLIGLLRDPDSL